ncbi:MAG: ATP-dependent sacrificial sulfur transferase LarE [Candidatus Omnitrophica bacterium]|nr:ATP-dependent sacrificial sulfur transferase LarE [Candidatus Omnitrophota bacterium]MDD5352949.1 ATP-dependent sacrificial sulfur transferase LarE [Candidatus Omnitrophota bacterium]MDD5550548.1 ATP-dependent sacrificial sulfur transferase LarE [Candidatus Omnitrophota bacterium]
MSTDKKLILLKNIISNMESVLVAYSGGLDSSFLLKIAKDCLDEKVLAVTAVSETYTRKELEFASKFCRQFNIKHKIINTHELENKNFNSNSKDRCYFCKKELFTRLKEIARKNSIKNVIDATNSDDRFDFRPGAKAKKELKVRSPLDEAGIAKEEIRSLSRRFNLPSWDKPQMACLASRIQYGSKITKGRLERIEKAENFLKENLGINGNIRVRDYGELARIEVDKPNIPLLIKANGYMMRFKRLGFKYITVDLEGYRTGSMNGE